MDRPNWAEGLHTRGNFYEGYIGNLQRTLDRHRSSTVMTYGVTRSHTYIQKRYIDSFIVTFRCSYLNDIYITSNRKKFILNKSRYVGLTVNIFLQPTNPYINCQRALAQLVNLTITV